MFQDIACKHQRSVESIIHKLCAEQITSEWYEARGYSDYTIDSQYHDDDIVKPSLTESTLTDDSNILNERINILNERINNLESSIKNIRQVKNLKLYA